MPPKIKTIRLSMPFHMGSVNCYLVQAEAGFILIDTGVATKRVALENELESAGCGPGSLKLIVLTHGDFDHTANAVYLRQKLGAKIAMHADEAGMLERGDMFWSRKSPNPLVKAVTPLFFRLPRPARSKPDLSLGEGDTLAEYGFDATVLHLPGHSRGSIGILTAEGDLFCGDLLTNTGKPAKNTLVDEPAVLDASVERLRELSIKTVYPGHGEPFPMEQFIQSQEP